jgi:hypothetical protein
MRCPKCRRFSKEVKVPDEKGELTTYSDCIYCGRILVEKKVIREGPEIERKLDLVKVFLALFFVVSAGLSGFFYYRMVQDGLVIGDLQARYLNLHSSYLSLLNTSSSLESYYNELQGMYSVLRSEYSDLENLYSDLLREKVALQREYDEIMNFSRSVFLEHNRTLDLSAGGNVTLSYNTIFSGFIEVNFTSSYDVFFWVGSSVTKNEFYARYPSFPETATNGMFTVPACATLYIYVKNPNEDVSAIVTLTIKYTY